MTRSLPALIFAVVVMSAAIPPASLWADNQNPPNILYILADDLGYADVGCYGGRIIQTLRIDQMREEGMKFTQHYSGSTVCAPTRCVLMTGRHTGNAWIRGNGGPDLRPSDLTIAEVLKTKNYTTGIIGKWGLGKAGSEGIPNRQGFDFWFGYLSQRNAHHYYPPFLWKNQEKVLYPDNPTKRTHYSHDLFTDEALEFIRQHKENPFFLYMAYTIPHVDLDVPEDSLEPYLGKLPEKGAYGRPGAQHYRHSKHPRATFAGMVTRLDRDIGRLLDLLDELGLSENTLVMFSSDNGPTSAGGADPEFFDGNGVFRGMKRDLYEGGIRVPMIARWPGRIEAGSTSNHISAHWDVLATCADLAGIPSSHFPLSDGISFLPSLIQSGPQATHPYLYWEFYERGGKQAIRAGKWKGVRLNVHKNPNAPIEIYNLEDDPSESRNLAGKNIMMTEILRSLIQKSNTPSPHFQFKSQ